VTWPDMWGPCVRERKREKGTDLGCGENGPRPDSVAGPRGSPGPFIYIFFLSFFFLLFCFLISFITFSNLVQIASNQFCKIPKIQSNILEQ
jgi:hypothetical protein